MLEIKVFEQRIETVTPKDHTRGTVGAKVRIVFDDFWLGYDKTVVFERCYRSVTDKPVRVIVGGMDVTLDIPPEIIAKTGKYKIGVIGIKDGVVLPTLYSEEYNSLYATETKGLKSADEYTPSELEQLRNLKQDKLIAGENIIIDENNVISSSGSTLSFIDICNGLPFPMKFPIKKTDNDTNCNVIYWNGTRAGKFYGDTDGASADNPIIIDTAEKLAYVASTHFDNTYGKYFKIADGIDKIVLQSETYHKDIISLDSAEEVKNYFADIIDVQLKASTLHPWVSNVYDAKSECFAGNFDGNGVEIYGMYTSNGATPNSGLSGSYAGGLFGIIDSAVITNVAIKNSYINMLSDSTLNNANWQFGLIASYGEYAAYKEGKNGISYINRCIVANNYIYKQTNNTSFPRSGVLLGGINNGNCRMQNCLVYGNSATGYYSVSDITEEYDLPLIGCGTGGNAAKEGSRAVLENSIILDTPLYAILSTGKTNVQHCMLESKETLNSFKNVYVDWDLDATETASVIDGVTHFDADYFLANGGAKITKSQIMGQQAVVNAPNLEWDLIWSVPKTYSGQSVPFDFHQLNIGILHELINNNATAINNNATAINNNATAINNNATAINNNATAISNNKSAINSKKITSVRTAKKYTFAWNAMYLVVSNSGKEDIKLYNSNTDKVIVDGDGNNLPASSMCLLILPQSTTAEFVGARLCMCISLTGTFSIVNPNVLKSAQFLVTSGDVYFTPASSSYASIFKIAF